MNKFYGIVFGMINRSSQFFPLFKDQCHCSDQKDQTSAVVKTKATAAALFCTK